MKSIENKTAKDIKNTDLKKMLISFGGVDRLENLHEFFCNVVFTRPGQSCFLLTDQLSDTAFKVMLIVANLQCILIYILSTIVRHIAYNNCVYVRTFIYRYYVYVYVPTMLVFAIECTLI